MEMLIFSDSHGKVSGMRRALSRQVSYPDSICFLGDGLLDAQVLESEQPGWYCVRGNCEAEVDQMVLNFPVLADYAILTVGKKMIFVTHGHVFNNNNLPPLHKGDILLHGHTHVPVCEEYETHIYMNPGSVSIPKENSPHGYMTFDGECFEWKTLDGEVYKEYHLHE